MSIGDSAIILASFLVLPIALGAPLLLIGWTRERTKIQRYMSERVAGDFRITLLKLGGGHRVRSANKNDVDQMFFRFIKGGHFYVYINSREPSELAYVKPDGTLRIYQLPDPRLDDGIQLHRHREIKHSVGASLLSALLTWFLTIVFGVLVFAAYYKFTFLIGPSPFYSLIAPALFLEIVIIFLLLLPIWLAVIVFRRSRYKNIVTNNEICAQCGYDLTGNESGVCPECGSDSLMPLHEQQYSPST
ncbi:MAG TPA: hypothetical protein PKN33_20060 [Phycisphaerae bacterium]|nr:hypothetical protein [Phycisphaerae bacterium]